MTRMSYEIEQQSPPARLHGRLHLVTFRFSGLCTPLERVTQVGRVLDALAFARIRAFKGKVIGRLQPRQRAKERLRRRFSSQLPWKAVMGLKIDTKERNCSDSNPLKQFGDLESLRKPCRALLDVGDVSIALHPLLHVVHLARAHHTFICIAPNQGD